MLGLVLGVCSSVGRPATADGGWVLCADTHHDTQTPHFKQFCNELLISIFPLKQHVCASVAGLSLEDVI